MARVIAVFNQKGGVGKTTTAMNLSGYLSMLGKKTLLIDFDSQFNATVGLGVKHAPEETIYHSIICGKKPSEVIRRTYLAGLDLVPASSDLAGALIEMVEMPEREFLLRKFVNSVRDSYKYIFIDLGPSLNLLTINGLLAADEVIVPVQCEYYSLEGIAQALETIELIQKNLGHPLKIGGALLTMYDKREKLSREIAREIRRRFPFHVYNSEIPRSVALAEAPSFQKPIMLYAPQSPGAIAYEQLANELAGNIPKTELEASLFRKRTYPEELKIEKRFYCENAESVERSDSLETEVHVVSPSAPRFTEDIEPLMLFAYEYTDPDEKASVKSF